MKSDKASIRWDDNDLPFSMQFEDHYFSRYDGRAETRHVFIEGNGLPQRWEGRSRFTIGELGFGTGLNFLETWDCWRRHRVTGQQLLFQSLEAFPMSAKEAAQALARWPELNGLVNLLTNRWSELGEPQRLDEQTLLQCHIGAAQDKVAVFQDTDAWFLDGFAPARNPEMWSRELMETVAAKTVTGGTFASYTAAGWVRRNLQEAGFIVEKHPGFGTKRDMIAGHKQ